MLPFGNTATISHLVRSRPPVDNPTLNWQVYVADEGLSRKFLITKFRQRITFPMAFLRQDDAIHHTCLQRNQLLEALSTAVAFALLFPPLAFLHCVGVILDRFCPLYCHDGIVGRERKRRR